MKLLVSEKMIKYKGLNVNSVLIGLLFVFFISFSVLWFISSYQYHIIRYQEEIQLFRTDIVYFQNYFQNPGGFVSYLSSFLTQFYSYFLGFIVYILSVFIFTLILYAIYRSTTNKFAFLVFPLSFLLIFIYNDINGVHFTLAHLYGLILILLSFLLYLKSNDNYRYLLGVVLLILCYFLAGGNCLLLFCLIFINELFRLRKFSYIFLIVIVLVTIFLPYFAYRFVYIVSLKDAYFNYTPFSLLMPNVTYYIIWLSIPILYMILMLTSRFSKSFNKIIPSFFLTFTIVFIGMKNYGKHDLERLAHTAFEIERGNWDEVLELTNEIKEKDNILFTYYRNIAYSHKNELITNLLSYRQTGTYGLFEVWNLYYNTTLSVGELYYWLGVPAAAKLCAFEGLVTSPYEYSSKALKRLIQISIQEKDKESFEKYIRFFEKSIVYKNWAKRQRLYFESSLSDTDCRILDFPTKLNYENFFFYTDDQVQNFIFVMEYNPENRKIFEYLAAYYLLRKNLFEFQDLLDNYYLKMNYTNLPEIFEEAIIILIYNNREELVDRYNIKRESLERFVAFNKEISDAKTNVAFQTIRNKYKNSYWVCFQYVQPLLLEETTNKTVY